MTARRIGVYLVAFFFIGIPISITFWLIGIWCDDPELEKNWYNTAGLTTVVTLAMGFIGGLMATAEE